MADPVASLANAQDFLDRGLAFDDEPQPVLLEVLHAALDRLLANGIRAGILAEHVLDRVVDDKELEDAGAAEVAHPAAVRADALVAVAPVRFIAGLRRS